MNKTDRNAAIMAALSENRCSASKLASEHGISRERLRQIVMANGGYPATYVKRANKDMNSPRRIDCALARELLEGGKPLREIAEILDVSLNMLWRFSKKEGYRYERVRGVRRTSGATIEQAAAELARLRRIEKAAQELADATHQLLYQLSIDGRVPSAIADTHTVLAEYEAAKKEAE